MRTRKLGTTDLLMTTIGLGTAGIGGGRIYGWAPRDEAESIATIHRALDLGINWLDTAPVYGVGHAEELVGRALDGRKDEVIIATKCDISGSRKSPSYSRTQDIRGQLEASLKRLKVEAIDLYQIHWPVQEDEAIEEAWSAIADLVREGKVRYAGVSNFSLGQLRRVQAIHPVASLQPPYSMLNREIEQDLLSYCAAHDIGVIVYSPMESGILTGRFTREYVTSLPPGDWRLRNPHFLEPCLSATLAFVERLRPIAGGSGETVGQLAIAWVLRRPEVTSAIVGARNPAQIEEMASAGNRALAGPEIAEIAALFESLEETEAKEV